MKFEDEYIKICNKLEKRKMTDWEVGDWLYYDEKVWMIHSLIDSYVRIQSTLDGMVTYLEEDDEEVWLPASPADWMMMEGWPNEWKLEYLRPECFFYVTIKNGDVIDSDKNPLLTCARAWETATREGEE